ncbi:MAG: YqgE/AlgH family protein [Hyphomonadaceae bacterium]|nr:YqgE/AlgH family protein [Hyphomonadaceae bacterium]
MDEADPPTLAGKLLVAMPGIGDPRFDRSVILMCAHDSEHAMGVILNKPKDELTLSDVLEHLGISAEPDVAERGVLDGGPVRPERGFVLHSEDYSAPEATQDVAPGVRLTVTREVLEAVAGENAPARFVLALGCAGWGAGQLEDELKHNAWLVVDADDAIIFGDAHSGKWERAIKSLGFEPAQLTGDAGSA